MYLFMALTSTVVFLAYIVIGITIVPNLAVPFWARVFGVLFFVTGGGTHLVLAIHGLAEDVHFLVEPHVIIINGIQAVVDWAFIFAARSQNVRILAGPREVPFPDPLVNNKDDGA